MLRTYATDCRKRAITSQPQTHVAKAKINDLIRRVLEMIFPDQDYLTQERLLLLTELAWREPQRLTVWAIIQAEIDRSRIHGVTICLARRVVKTMEQFHNMVVTTNSFEEERYEIAA